MRAGERGFTYVAAIVLVAVVGAVLAAIGEATSHARQREKEAELLWIGAQFTQAIGLYYHRSPGAVKRYPGTLEDLLQDRRFPSVQRYLRRLYPDPMTGKTDWALVLAPEGGVMGIHSSSAQSPLRTRSPGTSPRSASYSGWRFIYEPPALGAFTGNRAP